MKTLMIIVAAGMLMIMAACTKPLRVLVVVGGHSYDTTEFYDVFRSLDGIRFDSVSHPRAMETLGSNDIDGYDAVVFYDYVPRLPLADSAVYIHLTEAGVPLLFLHHSICSFQRWDGFAQMVGGRYVMPGFGADSSQLSGYQHDIDLEVKVLDPGHPVTSGMEDFVIHDEGYSNLLTLEGITPLLTTEHPDCHPLVGWTHQYRNSRVIFLIFGHDHQAYENPAFGQLLQNAVFFLAGNS